MRIGSVETNLLVFVDASTVLQKRKAAGRGVAEMTDDSGPGPEAGLAYRACAILYVGPERVLDSVSGKPVRGESSMRGKRLLALRAEGRDLVVCVFDVFELGAILTTGC